MRLMGAILFMMTVDAGALTGLVLAVAVDAPLEYGAIAGGAFAFLLLFVRGR